MSIATPNTNLFDVHSIMQTVPAGQARSETKLGSDGVLVKEFRRDLDAFFVSRF